MKTETSPTPGRLTGKITLEQENYLLITDASNSERIDVDLEERIIRVYSDKPWQADIFERSGQRKQWGKHD